MERFPPYVHSGDATHLRMTDAAIALLPAAAGAVWFFGSRGALVLAAALAGSLVAEALWARLGRGSLRDGSAAVTGLLLGLLLPASCPWWAAMLGGVLAISCKALSGGLGRNLLNPAILGRMLLLPLCPAVPPGDGPYLMAHLGGALGEASSLLLLAGAVYLALRRLLPWAVTVPYLAAAVGAGTCLGAAPTAVLCWGGTALGACFLTADPVTSPMDLRMRVVYGIAAGGGGAALAWLGWGAAGVAAAVLVAGPLLRGAETLLLRRVLHGAAAEN